MSATSRVGIVGPSKTKAAAISIASNSLLIVLKIVAGAVTGSVAIITEAAHSGIDLLASVVAFFSLRVADEPADELHPFGHAKVENVAAAIEGVLILIGAAVILFESVRRLVNGEEVEKLGFGIAVIAFSTVVNFGVSGFLYRRARETDSPALAGDAAHLRTDAFTSMGVLVGLVLVQITGIDELDAVVAILVAFAIVGAGLRILARSTRELVDEALPPDELQAVRDVLENFGSDEVAGFHKLRARRAGSYRHLDLHVQFRAGTTLERAHELSHVLQREIRARFPGADVLIHIEPESSAQVHGGGEANRQEHAEVADVPAEQQ